MAWANGFARIFVFARAALGSARKNVVFRYNNGYKQRLGPLVAKRRQFSDLFSWARVLKWGRKTEKQWKRKLGISAVTIRFTVRGWNAILTERHSGKTKQITNWSVSSFKRKLKFFRFKIVKYETRAFKRKIEIKPIHILFILLNISRLPRTITSDIRELKRRGRQPEENFSCAWTQLSPWFLHYSSLMETRCLAMWMWLCEGKLKVKIPHFRLPSAYQKRACLLLSAFRVILCTIPPAML